MADSRQFDIVVKSTADTAALKQTTVDVNNLEAATTKLTGSTLEGKKADDAASDAADKHSGSTRALRTAQSAANQATAAYEALLSGNYLAAMKSAQTATLLFNASLRANPMGLIVVGTTLAITTLGKWITQAKDATAANEKLGKSSDDASKAISREEQAAKNNAAAVKTMADNIESAVKRSRDLRKAQDELADAKTQYELAVVDLNEKSEFYSPERAAQERAKIRLEQERRALNSKDIDAWERQIVANDEFQARMRYGDKTAQEERTAREQSAAARKEAIDVFGGPITVAPKDMMTAVIRLREQAESGIIAAEGGGHRIAQHGEVEEMRARADALEKLSRAMDQVSVAERKNAEAQTAQYAARRVLKDEEERTRQVIELNLERRNALDIGSQAGEAGREKGRQAQDRQTDAERRAEDQRKNAQRRARERMELEKQYAGDPEKLAQIKASYDYQDAGDIADPAERAMRRQSIHAEELARNPMLYAPNIARNIARAHPGTGTITQDAARQLQYAADALQRHGIQPGEAAEFERTLKQFMDRANATLDEQKKIRELMQLIQAQQKNSRS